MTPGSTLNCDRYSSTNCDGLEVYAMARCRLLSWAWWHMVDRTRGASCPICLAGKQSIGHILNGCQTALALGLFTYRHDAVLRTTLTYITKEQNNTVMWKRRRGDYVEAKKNHFLLNLYVSTLQHFSEQSCMYSSTQNNRLG